MRNLSKKTPWHLRFAPGAILRKNGLIAVLALTGISAALTPVQTKAATFIIDVIASWAIGDSLTAAKNKLLADNGGLNKTPGATLAPTAKSRREHGLLAFQLLRANHEGRRIGFCQPTLDGKLDDHNRNRQPTARRQQRVSQWKVCQRKGHDASSSQRVSVARQSLLQMA